MSGEEVQKPTAEELENIRIKEQVRMLALISALGDELRRISPDIDDFDLNEASDKVVEQLKLSVVRNITSMKQLSQAGHREHHIQIFIAYSQQTLEVYTEAVAKMNKKKYYGLEYRMDVSPGVFVVWASWL